MDRSIKDKSKIRGEERDNGWWGQDDSSISSSGSNGNSNSKQVEVNSRHIKP
jgi:hypothetical protein